MAWVASTFDEVHLKDSTPKYCKQNRCTYSDKGMKVLASKKQCVNLWVDEYPPASLTDLAVHKKKVQEVQSWLNDCSKVQQEKRLLLLTGPPGSGKSTVIRTLARELNLTLREWVNSAQTKQEFFRDIGEFGSFQRTQDRDIAMNQSDRFEDFIFRSSKYKNICTSQSSTNMSLILIEEYPHIFTMNPLQFHLILRKYSACCTTPIIFILSEANNSNMLKTLFPNELQDEIFIHNITFNPINSSLLQSALLRVLKLTDNDNSSFFDSIEMSKKEFVQFLADRSEGDIRSAVNSLQFAMMRDNVATVPKKVKGKSSSKEKSEALNNLIGFKDSTLLLFRALGKVLYCKRENATSSCHTLPKHLQEHERHRILLENPEEVFERSGTEPSTFSLFLHHNCPPFFEDIERFSAALQYLGDADVLGSFWDPSKQLDTYVSSLSVRGMMHNLNVKGEKKGSQSFRSLTRPAWYNYVSTSKERLRRCQTLHKSSVITSEELTTSYIPLVAKIFLSSSAEADRFVREVGLLFPPPVSSASSTSTQFNASICCQKDISTIPAMEDDDEFLIEEIDD